MIFWLDDALFVGKVADIDRFALFRLAAMRRHTVTVSENPAKLWSASAINFDAWHKSLPPRLRNEISCLYEGLRLISSNAVTRAKGRPVLVTHREYGAGHCHLTVSDAIRALGLPLHILVENQINDAAFLRYVMPPVWAKRIGEWEREGRLRYVQGGGITEINRSVAFHSQDKNALLAFGLPARIWKLLHFVVYDHDGDKLAAPSKNSRNLQKLIDGEGLSQSSHRLHRRCQENYLPKAVVEKIALAKITDQKVKETLAGKIADHFGKESQVRHFTELKIIGNGKMFKSKFSDPRISKFFEEVNFDAEGFWPEMTLLAEAIAAAM